jgi:DNA-3-methyladenine glycosylase I
MHMKETCRCAWAGTNPVMVDYHDTEWGVPVHNDRLLFEFIILEGAQAGLSWNTILQRRENYRRVFAGFDPEKVARFSDKQIEKALADPGIIRNRLKVHSAVSNAQAFLRAAEEFGSFDKYVWQFVGGQPIVNQWQRKEQVPAVTPEAEAMAKDLKKRGFKFMGATICYAHMQATGMVNDHTVDCFRWAEVSG